MRKLIVFCLASVVANMAHAASGVMVTVSPYVGRRVEAGQYKRVPNKSDKNLYAGGRLALSLLSWDNKFDFGGDENALVPSATQEYSLETLFGGSAFVGTDFKLYDTWFRADLEAGLIGRFEDSGDGFAIKLTVPYVIANGYYDFSNNFYAGMGVGVALPMTRFEHPYFVDDNDSKIGVSPMFALMAGWFHNLNESVTLDVRYRLSTFMGNEHSREINDVNILNDGYVYTSKTGWVLENSLSVGLRYNF